MVTAGWDARILVYALDQLVEQHREMDMKPSLVIDAHALPVLDLVCMDHGVVVSIGKDAWGRVWNIANGQLLEQGKWNATALATGRGGVFVGAKQGLVVWRKGQQKQLVGMGQGQVTSLHYQAGYLVAAFEKGAIRVWGDNAAPVEMGKGLCQMVTIVKKGWWKGGPSIRLGKKVDKESRLRLSANTNVKHVVKHAVDWAFEPTAENEAKEQVERLRKRVRQLEQAGTELVTLVEHLNATPSTKSTK